METTGDNRVILEATLGRSAASTVGGAAAVVLSILGLAGLFPDFLMAVSVLAVGTALLFKGAALAAEYPKALARLEGTKLDKAELGGGMSAELLAGAAGIVLGILSLLGVATLTLGAVAIIVFGAAMAMSSAATQELNSLKIAGSGAGATARRIAEESVNASISAQVLVGLGAATLGILALIGLAPTVLTLVALLSIGGASLLTGSAIGGRLVNMFTR